MEAQINKFLLQVFWGPWSILPCLLPASLSEKLMLSHIPGSQTTNFWIVLQLV
jgi:hypothetical protein